MDLGTLSVKVRAELQDLYTGLQKSEAYIRSYSTRTGRYIDAHAEQWKQVGKQVLTTASAVGWALERMASSAAAYGEEILAASKATGMSLDMVQNLKYAAEQEDSSFDAVQKTLYKLIQADANYVKGNEDAINAFTRLGISATDSAGNMRQPLDLLLDLSETIKSGKKDPEDMAAALELIGVRGAKEVLPFLAIGKERIRELFEESEKYGNLTKEQIRTLDEYSDEVKKMNKELMLVKENVAEGLIPVLRILESLALSAGIAFDGLTQFALDADIALDGLALILLDVAIGYREITHAWKEFKSTRLGSPLSSDAERKLYAAEAESEWLKIQQLQKKEEGLGADIKRKQDAQRKIREETAQKEKALAEIVIFPQEGKKPSPLAKEIKEAADELKKTKNDFISEFIGAFEWKPAALLAGGGREFGNTAPIVSKQGGNTVLQLTVNVEGRADLHRALDRELDKLAVIN